MKESWGKGGGPLEGGGGEDRGGGVAARARGWARVPSLRARARPADPRRSAHHGEPRTDARCKVRQRVAHLHAPILLRVYRAGRPPAGSPVVPDRVNEIGRASCRERV